MSVCHPWFPLRLEFGPSSLAVLYNPHLPVPVYSGYISSITKDTEDKRLTLPKHRYDPDFIGIRQQHPPDPAITTGTNDGPRDDTVITALENQRF
jgi:hypothetical protein